MTVKKQYGICLNKRAGKCKVKGYRAHNMVLSEPRVYLKRYVARIQDAYHWATVPLMQNTRNWPNKNTVHRSITLARLMYGATQPSTSHAQQGTS